MTETQLKRIRGSHARYMAKWKKEGKPYGTYTCTHCGQKMETTKPTGGIWRSLLTCIHCGSSDIVSRTPKKVTVIKGWNV